MQDENQNKLDVSYGVDNDSASAETIKNMKKGKKKSNMAQAKTQVEAKTEEAPKKPSLISEINEMKARNDTRSPEFAKKMSELENILGVDQINPFGTNELDVFEDKLKGMSERDLQDMAYKVGLNPYIPGQQLKGVLKSEFKSYNRNNMRNSMPTKVDTIKLDPNNPDHAETIKIIGEV
jgi:hypothetical protein